MTKKSGIQCSGCESSDTSVADSRYSEDENAVKRIRECNACGTRFATWEATTYELHPSGIYTGRLFTVMQTLAALSFEDRNSCVRIINRLGGKL